MKIYSNYHERQSISYDQATPRQRRAIESRYGGLIDLDEDKEFCFYRGDPYYMGDCMRRRDPYWNGYFDDTSFSLIFVHSTENGYIFGIGYATE